MDGGHFTSAALVSRLRAPLSKEALETYEHTSHMPVRRLAHRRVPLYA